MTDPSIHPSVSIRRKTLLAVSEAPVGGRGGFTLGHPSGPLCRIREARGRGRRADDADDGQHRGRVLDEVPIFWVQLWDRLIGTQEAKVKKIGWP